MMILVPKQPSSVLLVCHDENTTVSFAFSPSAGEGQIEELAENILPCLLRFPSTHQPIKFANSFGRRVSSIAASMTPGSPITSQQVGQWKIGEGG